MRVFAKVCQVCGTEFTAHSGNAKYCPDCREERYKEQLRLHSKQAYRDEKAQIRRKYADGVVFICDCCGQKILVHGRTNRKTCTRCLLSIGGITAARIKTRKPLEEEVIS